MTTYETEQALTISRNTFPFVMILTAIGIISIPLGIQSYSGFYPSLAMGVYFITSIFSGIAIVSYAILHPTRRIIELDLSKDSARVYYLVFGKYVFNSQSYRLSDASDIQLIVQPYHNSSPTFRSIISIKNGDQIQLLGGGHDEEANSQILDLVHRKTGLKVSITTKAPLHHSGA